MRPAASSFDVDDAGILIALAAAAAVLLGASIWVVATAPTLFAELLLDGRPERRASTGGSDSCRGGTGWSRPCGAPAIPFALTAVMLVTAGWAMERYAPGGAVLRRRLDQKAVGAVPRRRDCSAGARRAPGEE